MPPSKTLILTALHIEAQAIARAFGVRLETNAPTPINRHGHAIDLIIIGIRAKHLPILSSNITQIIIAGVAGALDPSLHPGDIILDPDGKKIHTASHIVATPQEKSVLFTQTHASAVDMETSLVRAAAFPFNIPVLAIRGITDTASEILPPELLRWIDPTGRPKPAALTLGLLTHPHLIPTLLKLNHRTTQAMTNVIQALDQHLLKNRS